MTITDTDRLSIAPGDVVRVRQGPRGTAERIVTQGATLLRNSNRLYFCRAGYPGYVPLSDVVEIVQRERRAG